MRYLVTAGPTREFIDAVRFVSNASSGRMGCALAEAAEQAGGKVTLIAGPLECPPPDCHKIVHVISARQMRRAVLKHADDADVIVMAAAVSDYRPERRISGKIKKSKAALAIRLVPNPDILAELGDLKRRGQLQAILVGFALEARDGRRNAIRKLREKNLDLIVLNGPEAMGAGTASVELIFPDGTHETLAGMMKHQIARRIVAAVLALSAGERQDA